MVPVERLKSLRAFRQSSDTAIARLAAGMDERTFSPGQPILREGEPGAALYLLGSGRVSVVKNFGSELQKTVARLEGEEFFGEMSFLEHKPHSASVVADSECSVFVLSRAAMDGLIGKDAPAALEQVLTLMGGLSSRLRSTTAELVTVFETARLVAGGLSIRDLAERLLPILRLEMGESTSVAFYAWNMFNDEYDRLCAAGPQAGSLVPAFEPQSALLGRVEANAVLSVSDLASQPYPVSPLAFAHGHLALVRIDLATRRQAVLVFYDEKPAAFDAGRRQMMETVAGVLAPALETARAAEEEASRNRLQRNKQEGYSL